MTEKTHRRLTAIVSADVAGYSRLMGTDEIGTLAALRAHRSELIDPAIDKSGGRIVKTMGDGLLLEFPSVVDAVCCAIEVQEGMATRNKGIDNDKQIVFRIGVNLGDIIIDGDDIHGDGVNVASRLEALAEPNGICIPKRVLDEVQDRLDVEFVDIGERTLKNIARPVHCFAWRQIKTATVQVKNIAEFMEAPAIAVLPFDNFSQNPEFEFFADGLSEDLTTLLSAYRDFPVIARNSAFTFKGKEIDVMVAGKQLGATYVVEGSVRVAGSRMRVNAQLIDVRTGHHLWAQKFDRDIEDIFALQDELSLLIAANISPTVSRSEVSRVKAASSGEIGQWAALLKAQHLIVPSGHQNLAKAHEILLAEERQAPDNSKIQALLALWANISVITGVLPWREARADMLRYARQAIYLDPGNSFAYTMLSCAEQYHGHLEAALQAAERSIELNPSAGIGYIWQGISKMLLGRAEESLTDFAMMERLSPLDPAMHLKHVSVARALHILQRYEEAVEATRMAGEGVSSALFNRILMISALALSGRVEQAQQKAASFQVDYPDVDINSILVNFKTRDPVDFERFKNGLREAHLNFE